MSQPPTSPSSLEKNEKPHKLSLKSSSKSTIPVASTPAPVKKKRVRTGCLTCRERHLKCDEGTPICNNCTKSHRVCRRGIKLNFIETKVTNPKHVVPYAYSQSFSICDESRTIASEYEGGLLKYPSPSFTAFPEPPSLNAAKPSRNSPTSNEIYIKSSPPLFTSEIPLPLSSFYTGPQWSRNENNLVNQNAYSAANNCYSIKERLNLITDPYMLVFLQFFCKNIAAFMDYLVPRPVFQRIVPTIALTNPALLNAIAACGAFCVSNAYPNDVSPDVAAQYYNEGNALLLQALKQQPRNLELCILTALFLTVYEILNCISFEQRTHIIGIQALLQQFTFQKNENNQTMNFPSSISEACFYIVIHADLFTARMLGVLPLWSPQQWGPILSVNKPSANPTVHYWHMKIIYIISRALHLNSLGFDPVQSSTTSTNTQPIASLRRGLLNELYQWESELPTPIRPLYNLPPGDKPFPNIFFSDPISALANAYYHSAVITIYDVQTGRAPATFRTDSLSDVDCNYHARRICGIVMTSDNLAVGVVTLWCFISCSKFIHTVPERKAMLAHLDKVRKTGWSNEDFLAAVLASWGGPYWDQKMEEDPVR